ncbi:molybdopterin-dependent oxidoreductase [Halorarum halobium]|uniref:molybdopterin-dependent oxidoreductase n=1 Tax=Halorarum halobium TaxID=3075121 RepID=UPI0028AC7033|nr:molybdopterin-dependent oxidoreductase [Halobaculum sp. XH14]
MTPVRERFGSVSTEVGSAVVALSAGVAGLVASYAAVGITPAFVGAPIANEVVRLTPGTVVTVAITTLGSLGSQLAFAGGLATAAFLLALVAGLGLWLGGRVGHRAGPPAVAGLGVALFGFALVDSPRSAAAAGVGAAVVVAAPAVLTAVRGGQRDGDDRSADGTPNAARRSVLASVAAALGVGLLGAGGRSVASTLGVSTSAETDSMDSADGSASSSSDEVAALLAEAEEKSLDVAGLEPLVSDSFYTVDVANVDPDLSREDWSLRVHGAVGSETEFTFADVDAMEHEHRFVSLRCVGEGLNGNKLDNALWTGVSLADLVEQADPEGEYVMLRAEDGFFEEFPIAALREGGFLAVGMNGGPLPRGHGAPARALIPGHWGEINVKWLTEVEVLDGEAEGYWEKRGWHGTGPVNTVAKLWVRNRLADGRVELAGAAYAGTRGIDRVEVSTDGGGTWTEADLSEPLPGEDVWRQWAHRYDPPDGSHEAVVRAVEADGTVQPREESRAFPSGPSGWVSATVDPSSL